jgi:hypothetical protein
MDVAALHQDQRNLDGQGMEEESTFVQTNLVSDGFLPAAKSHQSSGRGSRSSHSLLGVRQRCGRRDDLHRYRATSHGWRPAGDHGRSARLTARAMS